MPYVRSGDGVTANGVPLTSLLGPGSQVFLGAPNPTLFVGNIPFGGAYHGPGTNTVIITNGNRNTAQTIANGNVPGQTGGSSGPGAGWFKYYLMN